MDGTRPTGRAARGPAPSTVQEPSSRSVAVLRLQGTAGNSVVSAALGAVSVQRHTGPTMNEEVGVEAAPGGSGTGTGTGTGTAETTPAPAASRADQIKEQMKTTDSGKWALGVLDKHSVPVEWEFAGVGSFHQSGKIFLNKTLSVGAAAIVMMHEAQHAMTFKTGKAADIAALSKDDFVKAKIADEAEAVVRAIEGAAPMAKAGTALAGSGLTAGLIKKYQETYAAKLKKLKKADAEKDKAAEGTMFGGVGIAFRDAVANATARTETRDELVTSWFHDGTFVTSTEPKVPYKTHYGNQWDKHHAPPAAAPATTPAASVP